MHPPLELLAPNYINLNTIWLSQYMGTGQLVMLNSISSLKHFTQMAKVVAMLQLSSLTIPTLSFLSIVGITSLFLA